MHSKDPETSVNLTYLDVFIIGYLEVALRNGLQAKVVNAKIVKSARVQSRVQHIYPSI